jgi:hypothetical protein
MGKILAPNNVSPRRSELNIVTLFLGDDVHLGSIFGEKAIMRCLGENELNLVN